MKTEKLVIACVPETVTVNLSELPAHESDALCRVLIRSITEAFKDPRVAADYKRWKREREKKESK